MVKIDESIDNYWSVRQAWIQPIVDAHIFTVVKEHTAQLLKKDAKALRMGAIVGNAEDKLELALRSATGITVRRDEEGAKQLLEGLVDEKADVPRSIRARAWALLAQIHFNNVDPKNIDTFVRAAEYANEACALGFAPMGILVLGMALEKRGYRRHEDLKVSVQITDRFAQLSELWRVVDRQKVKTVVEALERDSKVAKDPNAYICAAEGCLLEPTTKVGLRKCSGRCVNEGKPAYCSKECQKKDWTRHKAFCREDAPIDAVATTKRQDKLEVEGVHVLELRSINLTDPRWAPHYTIFLGETGASKSVFAKKYLALGGGLKADEESINKDLTAFDEMVRSLQVTVKPDSESG